MKKRHIGQKFLSNTNNDGKNQSTITSSIREGKNGQNTHTMAGGHLNIIKIMEKK